MGFKNVLKSAFPFIATAANLGGPLGTMAANAVGKALGVDKVDPANLEQVITDAQVKDPDAFLKLHQAENDFKVQMETLGVTREQIEAEDTANARSMQIATKSIVPPILAFTVTFGFFGLIGLIIFHGVPAESRDIVYTMVGTLGVLVVQVFHFSFGTTSQSERKTELLAQAGPIK